MKKRVWCFSLLALFPLFLSGCPFFKLSQFVDLFSETRTGLIGMNVIGIVGPPEAEIEIRYSSALVGESHNETRSIRVSPPYLFKDNRVYMTYLYRELAHSSAPSRPHSFIRYLLRNFEEGGAEYLTIINHSPEHSVEFFITGAQSIRSVDNRYFPPNITYRDTPLYYLLFPERNPLNGGAELWTVERIAELYRAEFVISSEIQLRGLMDESRMIDLVEGRAPGSDRFRGAIFYSSIEPGEKLQADEKIWLLATPVLMFDNIVDNGPL